MSGSSQKMLTWGALTAAGTLGYAAGIEPFLIETVHQEISLPRLPLAFDGYTVYVVSDLHTRRFGRREDLVRSILGSLPEPDLLALPGDMVHTTRGIAPFLKLAESFRARDGIYAVYGNSEYKNGIRPRAFAQTLAGHGIVPLLNRSITVSRGDAELAIAGVDDPVNWVDDVDLALEGVPAERCVVMLMHSPDSIAHAVRRGVDLVLSGHTHGGQIRLPLFGAPHTHVSMGNRMNSGYYSLQRLRGCIGIWPGRTQLYVTRGIGVSGLALRFLCRPELTILTLRRGKPGAVRRPVPVP